MVGGEAMKVAVGVGCRKDCAADVIAGLVRQAIDGVPEAAPLGLFTLADKKGERGLAEAAERLGLQLTYLSREVLKVREAETQTRSAHAENLFGVASIAEAAALAGAGPGSVLLVSRIAGGGATCAIARAAP
jgi:cobalt-precorrin 5A hydrolase